jgi:hypothetical protein
MRNVLNENVRNPNMALSDKFQELALLHQLSLPGISQRGVAASLGVSVSVVNPLVKRALVGGLVDCTGAGRRMRYALTAGGERKRRELAYELLFSDTPIYDLVRADVAAKVKQLRDQGIRRVVVFGEGPMLELGLVALLGHVEVLGRFGPAAYGLSELSLDALEECEPDAVLSMVNEAPADLRRAVRSHGIAMVFFT